MTDHPQTTRDEHWRVLVNTEALTICAFIGEEQVCRKMATDMIGKPLSASGVAGNDIPIGRVICAYAERITS